MTRHLVTAIGCLSCFACATARTAAEVQSPSVTSRAERKESPAAANQDPADEHDQAHRLVIAALACWSGGLWSDAERIPELERADASHRRCKELIRQVYGSDDPGRYERLRALDEVEISNLREQIAKLLPPDSDDAPLLQLLTAIADAERETMYARRAGEKVKTDIDVPVHADKRHADEVKSDQPLLQTTAFETLAKSQFGDLTPEAQTVVLMNALDRVELARGLPKHLKLDVVAGVYSCLFGVPPPARPLDPSKPLENGAWLAYLTQVAAAAGHPVPPGAASLRDRELMAWGGIAMGFADRMRTANEGVSDQTELKSVADAIARRLATEYHADEAAMANEARAER